MKSKYKEITIFTLIIALQVLVVIYWAGVKTNYHVDELYSMGYSRNILTSGEYYQYLTICPEFGFDKWINASDLKQYLVVQGNDRIFKAKPFVVVRSFLKERNYYGLLNLSESLFGYSDISSVPGVALNIILFVLAQILLISLMKKLNMDPDIRYLAVAMFGFSGYMITLAEYVRFYMLVILLMLVILNLSHRAWSSDKWGKIITAEAVMVVAVYFSLKNSELTIPFFGAFWACFVIAALFRKKWKQFISGVTVCICGLAYIALKTDYLGALFDPEGYKYLNNVWITSSMDIRENLSNLSLQWLIDFATRVKDLFVTRYFASASVIPLFLGVVTICLILSAKKVDATGVESSKCRIRPITIGAFIIWGFLLFIATAVGKGRLICIFVLFVILCLMLKELTGITIDLKKIRLSSDTWFMLVLLAEAVICIMFEGFCSHRLWRYYCFGFVSVTIVLWYVIDRILKIPALSTPRRSIILIMTGFIIVNSIIPFKTRNIENIFEEERDFVEAVTDSSAPRDVVLISEIEDGVISRHELYDCVAMVPEGTKIMVTDIAKYKNGGTDLPAEFLLWTYDERDISKVTKDLIASGYKVGDIGSDHCSKAYLVHR